LNLLSSKLEKQKKEFSIKERELTVREANLVKKESALFERESALNSREEAVTKQEKAVIKQEKAIMKKEKGLSQKEKELTQKERVKTAIPSSSALTSSSSLSSISKDNNTPENADFNVGMQSSDFAVSSTTSTRKSDRSAPFRQDSILNKFVQDEDVETVMPWDKPEPPVSSPPRPASAQTSAATTPVTETEKVRWINDEDVNACMNCNDAFGFFNRKHHCRSCGNVLCSKCSSKEAYVPQVRARGRVCTFCFDNLKQMASMNASMKG
jgi:hypothetical protein